MVYVRATYPSSLTTCKLVIAKTRVAPLKKLTIPRLELCGAALLVELLATSRETLDNPLEDTHAWCDSTIVLAWLKNSPSKYKTFVVNRVATAASLLPPSTWKHVPTLDNPADCASRGMSAKELKEHELWWKGPPWLLHDPVTVPTQPQAAELADKQEEESKPLACYVARATPATWLEHKFSSYSTLLLGLNDSFSMSQLTIRNNHPSEEKVYLSRKSPQQKTSY